MNGDNGENAVVQSELIDVYLEPYSRFLNEEDVIEISVNKPGGIFVERAGKSEMEFYKNEEITRKTIERLAQYIAGQNEQYINSAKPLLSGALPGHERIQMVLSPAAIEGGALSIRKQYIKNITLEEYNDMGAFSFVKKKQTKSEIGERLSRLLDQQNYLEFLQVAIKSRISILISGGTNTGKTTFLNACLASIPAHERIITIQDTDELNPPQKNVLKLIASKGKQGVADVTIPELMEASLRLRPDRLLIGELRGEEAFSFLRAVNTGHPGSMTTVHANDPRGAYQQLMLMVLQSSAGKGLDREFLEHYIKTVMPVVIQFSRQGEERGISEVYYHDYQEA